MTSTTTDTIRLRSRLSREMVAGGARTGRNDRPTRPILSTWTPRPPEVVTRVPPPAPAGDDIRILIDRPTLAPRFLVRAFDLTVAVTGLIVLAPVMLVLAVLVKAESRGPVLYGSTRVGYRKPLFKAWKFRSMRPDADAVLDELLASDEEARAEYELYHKLRNDPRLTRLGSFIRRTSLDELPQLFNILVGEMSVVGPRPKSLVDAEVFGPALDLVLQVKPGLTGLWQVSGRNQVPIQDRVALDVEYALTRTITGDLRICARTLVQLWRPGRHGAY
jgi:exopolysaccharide production protein ExoY